MTRGSREVQATRLCAVSGGADDDGAGECAAHTSAAGDGGDATGDGDGVCANDGDDELGSRRSS